MLKCSKNEEKLKMVVDISEHKKTVEALKETTDLLQSIMNSATEVMIIATDPIGIILSWNEGARKILGYEPEEVIGKKNIRLFHTKKTLKSGAMEGAIKNMEFTRKPLITELNYITKKGRIFPAQLIVTPRFSDNGKFIGMLGISIDISKQKQAEEALHESEEKFRALSDATLEAIFISEKGVCIETNQAAIEMFGYTYDELIGIFGTDVIAPESKEIVKQNILSGYEEPYEAVALRKDGTKFLAEFEGKMFNYKGRNVRVTAVRDITVRKNAEKEIEKLKQMLLKSQMNPHFVFNSLIAIQSFIYKKKPVEASNYLSSFAKLIRYILNSSTEDYVPIEKEIQAINHYLELQKLRFDNKFDYSVYVDPEINIEIISIPPMLVQPFIENSIEHGIQHKKTKGNIDVRFILKNNTIFFEVEDDGIGRAKAGKLIKNKDEIHKSFGTSITKERIANLNKSLSQKIKLNVIDLKDSKENITGTKVTLNIPFK